MFVAASVSWNVCCGGQCPKWRVREMFLRTLKQYLWFWLEGTIRAIKLSNKNMDDVVIGIDHCKVIKTKDLRIESGDIDTVINLTSSKLVSKQLSLKI
jgi:hypothetical protein